MAWLFLQMRSAINFINTSDEDVEDQTRPPANPELEASLSQFHEELMTHCRLFEPEVEGADTESEQPGMLGRLFGLDGSGSDGEGDTQSPELPPGIVTTTYDYLANIHLTCVVYIHIDSAGLCKLIKRGSYKPNHGTA